MAAAMLGLADIKDNPNEAPTRGELAVVIHRLLVGDYKELRVVEDIPPVFDSEDQITPTTFTRRNAVLAAMDTLPEGVVDSFLEDGWIVKISGLHEEKPEYSETVAGLTSYVDKVIYIDVSNISTSIHELAHYIEDDLNLRAKVDSAFEAEHESASGLLRSYAQTNPREYFACAVEYYYLNDQEQLEEGLPVTYSIVQSAINSY